jgi:ankyrin repeat protein
MSDIEDEEMERGLWLAASRGEEEEVGEILKENPDIAINWEYESLYCWTALHVACRYGHDKVVSLLLAHPDLDVNSKNVHEYVPFLYACGNERTDCAQLLLKDARVKVNEPTNDGYTPLWYAAYDGHLDLIK